jgi:nicotinate-nucleotide pyrophosphorylase (carboxylating)
MGHDSHPLKLFTSADVERAVKAALYEDVGSGDATTMSTVPADASARSKLVAREQLVLAGVEFAETAFRQLQSNVEITRFFEDGSAIARGQTVLEIRGKARALLTAERVALNFIQRLSGVATQAALFVKAVEGTGARILDTRKTTPGWRLFEKYAVKMGGGTNHRIGLYDMVLIKDNHLAALRDAKPNAIAAAVSSARKTYPNLKIEVEADTLEQVEQAVAANAEFVLLDNMKPEMLKKAVAICRGKAQTEASGGVNFDTVRAIAESGVNFISIGALTHSARAVDLALDFEQ